ncbi:Gfo/Idh/MocA family protein [Rhizobium sullae]|uniref:Gfo/Idh/MocA family protein n=1 Tax=Rhizobium sullae TaxID=50338 RepID=UPI003CC9134C
MTQMIRWGVLGCAGIAIKAVIPAIQSSRSGRVTAIASRDPKRAEETAAAFGIAKAYGSYETLLADADIDAIYNPLPNHLDVPLTIKALEQGKPVLCEKPIALSAGEAMTLAAAQKAANLPVAEAFIARHHPQWKKAQALVAEGWIGEARVIQTIFSYYLDDPRNVRNQANIGGGGTVRRRMLRRQHGALPVQCRTLAGDRADGTRPRLRYGPPRERTARASRGPAARLHLLDAAHPFFSGLDDAIANMKAIDALFRSATTGRWEAP